MAKTTITEALAELKTIEKRIEKKRQFVMNFIGRLAMNRDPLEKEGGAVEAVRAERQAIDDLHQRTINIRRAIQRANDANLIIVEGDSRSIADWLVWRREVAPHKKTFLDTLRQGINNARSQAKTKDAKLVESAGDATGALDVIVHVSERELAEQIEKMETVMGTLDGQLSLKNATITIDVD